MGHEILSPTIRENFTCLPMYYFYPSAYMRIAEATSELLSLAVIKIEEELCTEMCLRL